MYRLLTDENFTPLFTTFYTALQKYRNLYLSAGNFSGLNKTEVEILSCVARENYPNNAKGIARYLNVSKPLVSQRVEFLVNEGYLRRNKNPKDRRWHTLSLGEKSFPILGKLLSLGDDFYGMIERGISEEEIEVFTKVLKKMTENLKEESSRIISLDNSKLKGE